MEDSSNGFIALITAILISALLLGITLTQSEAVFVYRAQLQESEEKAQSRTLAGSCASEAILRLTLNPEDGGNEVIHVAEQTCTIGAIAQTATGYMLHTKATVHGSTTTFKTEISGPPLQIISQIEEY